MTVSHVPGSQLLLANDQQLDAHYDAIVIGSGHNGLIAACYLARDGQRVLVLDRRQIIGGACTSEEVWPGYLGSTCAYNLYGLAPRVIDELDLFRHGLEIIPLAPRVFWPFADGRSIFIWDDDERNQQEIAKLSERDAARYPEYLAVIERITALFAPYFLNVPPTAEELRAHAHSLGEAALLQRVLTGSLAGLLEEYFETPEVRATLMSGGDFGDPYQPGTLLPVAVILGRGTPPPTYRGIVRGGMGGVSQALGRAALEAGVTIATDCDVAEIVVSAGGVRGVRLTDGRQIAAALVVSNADPKTTFTRLVSPAAVPPEYTARIAGLRTRSASVKLFAGLRALPDFSHYLGPDHDPRYLAYMRLWDSLERVRAAWQAAERGELPQRPNIIMQIPSVVDPSIVPPGKHLLSCWVTYAPQQPAEWWAAHAGEFTELIFRELARYTPNLADVVEAHMLITPADIERRMGMTDGNIRHIDMIAEQMLDARPAPGYRSYGTPIAGLYLCGSGTHPGGEVTGAPGHNAAQLILGHAR